MPKTGIHAPYSIQERNSKRNKKEIIFYVQFWNHLTRKYETAISTGKDNYRDAVIFAEHELKKRKQTLNTVTGDLTFREYAEPFYTENCPHCSRLKAEGKKISDEYINDSRGTLNNHIFPIQEFCSRKMNEISKRDGLMLREYLIKKNGLTRSTQKAFGLVKAIFSEAEYREDIPSDPFSKVSVPRYEEAKRNTFTREEIMKLFFDGKDHWDGAWLMFFTCACTGMRRGEVLGLRWEQIDFDNGVIEVNNQIKKQGDNLPKWRKVRTTALPNILKKYLIVEYDAREPAVKYVFHDKAGNPHQATYWEKHFKAALKSAEISTEGRNLVPHSLRHMVSSELTDAGLDDRVIMSTLGWNDKSTKNRYTHQISLDPIKRQGKIIDEIFSKKEKKKAK